MNQRPVITRSHPEPATAVALAAMKVLAEAGVPIFLAPPAGGRNWDPAAGTGGCGYWRPKGWQNTEPDPTVVDRWKPGMGVAAVMGLVVDGIDVDPRHGGHESIQGLPLPRVYGVTSTPSAGWHGLICALGVGSRDAVRPGIDLKGGRPDGSSRGALWLPPTRKLSKVTGELGSYRWLRPPDLDGIEDDGSGAALAQIVRVLRNPPPTSAPRHVPDLADGGRGHRYVSAAVQGELQRVLDAQPGERNQTLVSSAFALGQFVGAAGLDEAAVTDALLTAAASIGLGEREANATIRSGLSAGRANPRSAAR